MSDDERAVDERGEFTMATKEAAKRLCRTPETLHDWARAGYGPPSIKVKGRRWYRLEDVLGFRQARPRLPIPKRPPCDVCGRSD